jgi:protein SCO1
MTPRNSSIVVLFAALCAATGGFWLALHPPAWLTFLSGASGPQLESGTWLPQAREIGDFHLTDHLGHAFTSQDLRGKPSLVFFGFTHCPDVCPTTLAKLAQLKKTAALPGLRVLFVSVDPQRDTPATMGTYVRAFDPDFIGLTGDPTAINNLASRFGIAVNRVELPGGDYTMDHSAAVFLLDAQGRIVAIFTPPFDIGRFAKDLRTAGPRLQSNS